MIEPNPFLAARNALVDTIDRGRSEGWVIASASGLALDAPTLTSAPRAMVTLQTRLALTATDVAILWLLAAIELDAVAGTAARCLIHASSESLSMQMVEQVVTGGARPLDPATFARLEQWMLVEIARPDLPWSRRAVRASDRVLDLARGYLALDRALGASATLSAPVPVLDPRLDPRLCRALHDAAPILAVATGREGSGRVAMLERAAADAGLATIRVRCDELAMAPEHLARQARMLRRECVLHRAAPILCEVDRLGETFAVIDRELAGLPGPVLATAREHYLAASTRSALVLPVRRSTEREREVAWQRSLATTDLELVHACAARYSLSPGLIAKAAATARTLDPEVTIETVQAALRGTAQAKLGDLARRVETEQTWDDLVLPDDQVALLTELVARMRHRGQVLEDWGFAAKVGRGLGLAVLLSGPPGTGKTMIAGLVAKELGLDLYQIDLARVVSKYIGETEKQLSSLFDAAEDGNAMLLFDEADALLGKRTELRTSNDRYANLEVNYLLQRIEAFTGIAVMTTNHESSLDPALLRRLAFHIRVPMPEADERAALWRAMIPAAAHAAEGIDFVALADKFVMSGGHIKNAVLRAAYLSADAGTTITTTTLWHGARVEYEAMGKVVRI
ncbi:MAG: AAA family ATPase [Kofleriaceae bacterium]